jgi:phosphoglycolate phosphatase-like HAD superfamily hydrolase
VSAIDRVVLFDVDGTLIDAHRAGRRALSRAFTDIFRVTGDRVERAMDRVGFAGRTDLWIIGQAAEMLDVELDGRRDDLVAAYLAALAEGLASRPARPLPGVSRLLAALRACEDRCVGLLTGNLHEGARIKLSSCGLDTFFEEGGFGEDGLERAAIGRIAHRRFETRLGHYIDPRDIAVVGDNHHDVDAARHCGFRAVAVDTGFGDPDLVRRSQPDVHLSDLTDATWLLGDWEAVPAS